MNIRLAQESDRDAWNAYMDRHASVPPMNRYEWSDVLRDSYGVQTRFFAAYDKEGGIRGVLPAYLTNGLKGKKAFYSLRFGCVADSEDIAKALFGHVKEFCAAEGISSNMLTSGYRKIESGYRESVKKTLVMDLGKDEESTWKALRDKTRNMIRKAERLGLRVEKGGHNIEEYYSIYSARMLEKGIPMHSLVFFRNMLARLCDRAELISAKKDGRVVAGIVILFSKNAAIYPFQAAHADFLKFAPNDLLVWEAVKLCIKRGITMLDMGESSKGGSVYTFKANFGGRPRDVYYYDTGSGRGGARDGAGEGKRSLTARMISGSPRVIGRGLAVWAKKMGRII